MGGKGRKTAETMSKGRQKSKGENGEKIGTKSLTLEISEQEMDPFSLDLGPPWAVLGLVEGWSFTHCGVMWVMHSVIVSMSAFLASARHQCQSVGLSVGWA